MSHEKCKNTNLHVEDAGDPDSTSDPLQTKRRHVLIVTILESYAERRQQRSPGQLFYIQQNTETYILRNEPSDNILSKFNFLSTFTDWCVKPQHPGTVSDHVSSMTCSWSFWPNNDFLFQHSTGIELWFIGRAPLPWTWAGRALGE